MGYPKERDEAFFFDQRRGAYPADDQNLISTFDQFDPTILKNAIKELISQYQKNRSKLVAWIVVRYAEALSSHPDYADIQEESCNYQRFSDQWCWLAQNGPELQPVLVPVAYQQPLTTVMEAV